jgi:hypothetical protein
MRGRKLTQSTAGTMRCARRHPVGSVAAEVSPRSRKGLCRVAKYSGFTASGAFPILARGHPHVLRMAVRTGPHCSEMGTRVVRTGIGWLLRARPDRARSSCPRVALKRHLSRSVRLWVADALNSLSYDVTVGQERQVDPFRNSGQSPIGADPAVQGREETLPPVGGRLHGQVLSAISMPFAFGSARVNPASQRVPARADVAALVLVVKGDLKGLPAGERWESWSNRPSECHARWSPPPPTDGGPWRSAFLARGRSAVDSELLPEARSAPCRSALRSQPGPWYHSRQRRGD